MEITENKTNRERLIKPQLVRNLEEKLKEINQIVVTNHEPEVSIGALTGGAGEALFLFNYAKYADDEVAYEGGITKITQCVDLINNGFDKSTFCAGIAGFGWVLDHLEMNDFVEVGSDDILPDFDDFLRDVMMANMKIGDYDFLHGAIGHAYYFLNRYRNTKSTALRNKYESILLEFINLLYQAAHENKTQGTLAWPAHDRYENFKKEYRLGLSHGIASIIGFLSKLSQYEVFQNPSKEMLKKTVRFVLNTKNIIDGHVSLYPTAVMADGGRKELSRLAWCNGDLGIGIRFWYASEVLGNNILKKEAMDIINFSTGRRSAENTAVVDSSICHGAYGNAQVFNRMYKISGDSHYKEATEFWLQDGLNRATHEDGIAGYKQYRMEGKWSSETSLLEGVAGIGLVILDYLTDYPSNWDECLMIS